MTPDDLLQLLSDQQARRLRVIENLLRGRRTVSTLYWGLRYDLLYLLDLDKSLDRGQLDASAQVLVDHHWAAWADDQQPRLRLTAAGVTRRDQQPRPDVSNRADWPQLNLQAARQRLLLAVQVVSEYAHQTKRYYPLTVDLPTRQAVRIWFHQQRDATLPQRVLTALQTDLDQLPVLVAQATTAGLTGHQQPGLTNQQLGEQLDRTAWQVYLMHVTAVVQIARSAKEPAHPLHTLLAPTWDQPVTRSAQATLATVQAGTSLDQTAQQRKIKPSTVREHLLEAAIMLPVTAIPYEQLLPVGDRERLLAALPTLIDDWEYTALSPALQARYDFFTFRLLAIWQDKRGVGHGTLNN